MRVRRGWSPSTSIACAVRARQPVPEAAAPDGLELAIDLPWTVPVPITPERLDALDAEVTSVFDPDQLITPDDVRDGAPTLEAAVLDTGWPSIDDSRAR